MTQFDASLFDFSAMKEAVGVDPFAKEANKYGKDERFYTLGKDKDGKGGAIIRFLPDSEKRMIQQMHKINTTITKNGKKRFVSEFSPSTIGLPCPFQEEWQLLWNNGDKDGSKLYSRGVRFVTNIKIIKDPSCPENEGKIFLYEMSGKMKDKVQAAVDPSEQDVSLGAKPKELFNPLRGHSFKLACNKGSNGQINYDASEVISDVTSIYDTAEAALDDIKNNTHKLSELIDPAAFMTYDELVKKKAWVTFSDETPAQPLTTTVASVQPVQTEVVAAQEAVQTEAVQTEAVQEPVVAAPSKSDDLDALLNDLI